MNRNRVLVISTWGLPIQWGRYTYTVRIEHRAFESLSKDFQCESCCTTLVLASYLQNAFDVDVLVFGIDTVANPSEAGEALRSEVKDLYTRWLQDLAKTCSCCSNVDWQSVAEISVLPGVGHYHGWHFKASVDNIFVKVFHKVYSRLGSTSYRWLFLDLTHGLNYVAVATLYATIANAIIFDKERDLVIVNSEPAAGSGTRCILSQQVQRVESASTLTILDVSRLQKVISFIRGVAALKYLQPHQLESLLSEIKEYDQRVAQILEKYVVPFFSLLSNGIAGPTFNNSYVVDEKGVEEFSPYALCRHRSSVFGEAGVEGNGYEFEPVKVDRQLKTVEYDSANIFSVLLLASKRIADDVCKALTVGGGGEHLNRYLVNLAKYYERLGGYLAGKYLMRSALDDLTKMIKWISNNIEFLRQNNLIAEESYLRPQIDRKLYVAITQHARVRDERDEVVKRFALVASLQEVEKKVSEEIAKLERSPDRFLRNMCAHAGLEYTTTERMVIDIVDMGIAKVVYNRRLIGRLLEHIGITS